MLTTSRPLQSHINIPPGRLSESAITAAARHISSPLALRPHIGGLIVLTWTQPARTHTRASRAGLILRISSASRLSHEEHTDSNDGPLVFRDVRPDHRSQNQPSLIYSTAGKTLSDPIHGSAPSERGITGDRRHITMNRAPYDPILWMAPSVDTHRLCCFAVTG